MRRGNRSIVAAIGGLCLVGAIRRGSRGGVRTPRWGNRPARSRDLESSNRPGKHGPPRSARRWRQSGRNASSQAGGDWGRWSHQLESLRPISPRESTRQSPTIPRPPATSKHDRRSSRGRTRFLSSSRLRIITAACGRAFLPGCLPKGATRCHRSTLAEAARDRRPLRGGAEDDRSLRGALHGSLPERPDHRSSRTSGVTRAARSRCRSRGLVVRVPGGTRQGYPAALPACGPSLGTAD